MAADRQISYVERLSRFGQWQLSYLSNRLRYWEFAFVEGRRLRKLKDIHSGERCFIIGNGPSIRKQNLMLLRDEITFATNWFVLHEEFDQLQINYYCISDPRVWWGKDGMPPSLYDPLNSQRSVTKFFEHTAKPVCKSRGLFVGQQCYFIWLDYTRKVRDGFVSLDISKGVNHGNTVIIDFCLPIACYMGFKDIYLLGCDCDYHLEEAPDFSKAYFYDIGRHCSERVSKEVLLGCSQDWVFDAYRVMKRALQEKGVNVYNAGVGGRLEVFERVELEKVL